MHTDFIRSTFFLFILLNPFLMIVYIIDAAKELESTVFDRTIIKAATISTAVFLLFAFTGETIFNDLLQARFESFQIFGGIVFLLIGLQFVFTGKTALIQLRGPQERMYGAIAMPLMIGPGTISASVMIGNRLSMIGSAVSIVMAVGLTALILSILKRAHDYVRPRNEPLIERYMETTGRVTALIVGTFSIEMIMRGVMPWFSQGV